MLFGYVKTPVLPEMVLVVVVVVVEGEWYINFQ